MATVDSELPGGPFGTSQLIGVRFVPGDGASSPAKSSQAATYITEISKNTPVGDSVSALAAQLGVPTEAITLMWEGRTLDLSKSMSDNEIVFPGVRARKDGQRVELYFDTKFDVMYKVDEADRKLKGIQAAEDQRLKQAAMIEMREQQIREEQRLRDEEERAKHEKSDLDFEEFISTNIGVDETRFRQLLADTNPDLKKPKHYLVKVSSEEEKSLADLLHRCATGSDRQIVGIYRNENQELWERYQRARDGLKEDARNIPKTHSASAKAAESKSLAFLEGFDADINEFPLWHCTGSAQGAGGICSAGFDIGYVGSATGTVWGHGFYFADDATVALRYSGYGFSPSAKHAGTKIIFLCRVLCGRINSLSSTPTQEDKERLTAQCLGSGGKFGPKSDFHSICGGGWCYVCAHNHQIYPQYLILFR